MSRLDRIYRLLPVPAQHLACSVVGYSIRLSRYDRRFHRILARTVADGELDNATWVRLRDERLAAFVKHAATTVPYYRRVFAERGLDYRDIRRLEDLAALPVIEKKIVQDNLDDFVSEAVPTRYCLTARTSGSTGAGLVFPVTKEAVKRQFAVWWRCWLWHGIRFGTPCAYFGGRVVVSPETTEPPYWRHNLPMRQTLFSQYHLSERTLPAYVEELRRSRLPWIHGFPSAVSLVAEHIAAHDVDLGYPIRFVTLGGERLLPHQAAVIERAFGVRPISHYGMTEAVANISPRPDGELYVDEDFAAVEFVPVENGEGHRIVGTNMTNPAFPLIRYDSADIATIEAVAPASQPYPGRRISAIDGRTEDYVVLADGRRVGRVDYLFKYTPNVREAQIVQQRPGAITLRIVRGAGYGAADEGRIREEAESRLGKSIEVEFHYVDAIEKTRAGKIRFVVSEAAGAE